MLKHKLRDRKTLHLLQKLLLLIGGKGKRFKGKGFLLALSPLPRLVSSSATSAALGTSSLTAQASASLSLSLPNYTLFPTSARSLLHPLIVTISLVTIALLPIPPSLAETDSIPQPSDAPLELDLLTQPQGAVITANTIDPKGLTVPSLWWAQENSENKLLDNWIAYSAPDNGSARIDLIVNQQIWSLLSYLERYGFVNSLGSLARKDGYNLRVFNYQQELLATYTCNFQTSPALCNIQMNIQNRLGLRKVEG